MTSGGYAVDLWLNLTKYCDGEFNALSNAVFVYALAIIAPEIMEVFRSDIRKSRKKIENFVIFYPGGHKFDLSEKLTGIVSSSFLTSFRKLFSVFLYDQ